MLRAIGHRILAAGPVLFGLLTAVFFLSRLLPGDPAMMALSPQTPPEVREHMLRMYGLDQPLPVQYWSWLSGMARGDFGYSILRHEPVLASIGSVFPNTLFLGVTAFLLEFAFAVFLAFLIVRFPNAARERVVHAGALVVYSLPAFWIGTLLLYWFAYRLGLFPLSHMHAVGAESLPPLNYAADSVVHVVLPALTLALPGCAGLIRYMLDSIRHTLNEPYVLAARGRGISPGVLARRYVLPGALLPSISLGGLEIGTLLAGTLVTESIFAWPGMGRLTIASILARDYPLFIGCCLVSGIVVIAGNLIADCVRLAVDPRLRRVRP